MNAKQFYIYLFIFQGLINNLFSQTISPDKIIYKDTVEISQKEEPIRLAEQKDIVDVYHKIFKPKKVLTGKDSLNLKSKFFSIMPAVGYAMVSGYTGVLAANMSFYADTNRDKISSIMGSGYYSQYNQYWVIINSNILTARQKLNLVGDWRIYRFPTNTYGLGAHNTLSDANMIDFNYLKIYQIVFRKIVKSFYAGIGYHLDYHYNIKEVDPPDSLKRNDFQKYGFSNKSISSGLSYDLLYDSRKNIINPKSGTYFNFQYHQNYTFLGSGQNWHSMLIDIRKYIKFPHTSSNVLAFWSYTNVVLSGQPPYLDLPSIGWDSYNNTGRGYVQGRFRGKGLIYFETEYRFTLSRNGLFGGVAFANIESVSDWPSNKFTTALPAAGVGLRLKLNKTSRVNLAIDYGIGLNGSRGFALNIGEVF